MKYDDLKIPSAKQRSAILAAQIKLKNAYISALKTMLAGREEWNVYIRHGSYDITYKKLIMQKDGNLLVEYDYVETTNDGKQLNNIESLELNEVETIYNDLHDYLVNNNFYFSE